tara:strand:+ start:106 stop:489 length:384 start_codon:yes stop_codon:yes gene_type:complete
MRLKNINSLSFLIFFIFLLFVFDAFTNSYIVLRENYDTRLIKGAGNCDKSGYGFYKKILAKHEFIDENITVINLNNYPSPLGYFFDYKKKQDKFLILIGDKTNKVKEYYQEDYKLLYNEDDCYLLSK